MIRINKKQQFNRRIAGDKKSKGFTLIELMVSSLIGFLLIGVVSKTFVWSSRSYKQDENTARLQESARYALDAISKDLQMSGFMHEVLNSTAINTSLVAGAISADCGSAGGSWATETNSMTQNLSQVTAAAASGVFSCINSSTLYTVGNSGSTFTDILAVKRVKAPSGPLINGELYLQTLPDGQARMIIHNLPGNPVGGGFADADNWEYLANIYYVNQEPNDDVPVLFRKTLQGQNLGGSNTLSIDTEAGGIAEGVEYFHITWGIDNEMVDGLASTPPDSNPNYFVSTPSTAEAQGIVSAKVYVLVRSSKIDPTYTDTKQYTLGDITIPPAGSFNDHYRRQVFSTSVKLRNRGIQNIALDIIK